MSFITGIPSECLFSNTADGTALASFTTEASLLQGMNGEQPWLPAGFFYNNAAAGKSLLLLASGVLGSTSANPTLTFFVRIGSTINVVTGTAIGQSAAITIGASAATVTNAYWSLLLRLTCRTPGLGSGNATLEADGWIQSTGFANQAAPLTGNTYSLTPSASASAWTFTIDPTQAQFLMLSASCSASNAANTVQLKDLHVLGLN